MAKISTFLITMVVLSMVVGGGYMAFMASISENYNPGDFNESKLSAYNKLAEIKSQTDAIENKTTNIQGTESGVIDILGGFFQSGYDAIALSFSSFSIFNNIATTAKEDIPNLDKINVFFKGTVLIVSIILIFLLLKIVVKGDI